MGPFLTQCRQCKGDLHRVSGRERCSCCGLPADAVLYPETVAAAVAEPVKQEPAAAESTQAKHKKGR